MYSTSPAYARIVLREVLHAGHAEEALFAGTSLNRSILEAGEDISLDDFVVILENGRQITGDDTLGLAIGRQSNLAVLGAVGLAMTIAPTLREGLRAMENFSRLHNSYTQVRLLSGLQGLTVHVSLPRDIGEVRRFHEETAAMILQDYIESISGLKLEDAQYRFRFARPDYAALYAHYLHSPVSFNHDCTTVELPRHWLDLKSPYFSPESWRRTQASLADKIRTLGKEDAHSYTRHVTALLQSCDPPLPDLATIASRMNLSERTLNRRLQQEDASFRHIKSAVLQTWAQQLLLGTGDSVESIAASLGYQDVANFRRAFRAWEGCAPNTFRRGRPLKLSDNGYPG